MANKKRRATASPATISGEPQISAAFDADRFTFILFIVLVSVEIALVILDAFINYGRLTRYGQLRRLFNIAREDGLATWVSSAQFLLAGVTLWFIHLRVKLEPAAKSTSRGWGLLAIFFIYLSADDAAKIHERMGSLFKAWARSGPSGDAPGYASRLLDFFPSYPWQIVVGPFFAAMGIFLFLFLWRQFKGTALRSYLVAGIALIAFAQGLDFVEGVKGGHASVERLLSLDRYTVRHFFKSGEEFIEMLGLTFLFMAFLKYLFHITREVELRLKSHS